jgi:vacuolar-type H+-ATPase subunit I/STV1
MYVERLRICDNYLSVCETQIDGVKQNYNSSCQERDKYKTELDSCTQTKNTYQTQISNMKSSDQCDTEIKTAVANLGNKFQSGFFVGAGIALAGFYMYNRKKKVEPTSVNKISPRM